MTGFVRLYLDAVVFVFGAVIGSFLNVCIHRMPRGESIVTPPSACPHCGTHIRWYHNIPLVTYLMIRGKCRYCGVSITPRYFVVELLTAVAFLAVWLRFDGWEPVIYWIMFSGLIAATFIDVERLIIPNEITLGGIIVGVLLSLLRPIPAIEALLQSLLGSLCGGGLLWLVVEAGKMLFGKLHISLYPQSQIVIVDRKIGYDLPASTERSKFQFFCFILLTMLYRLLPVSRVLRRWFIKFTHTRFSAVRFPRRHEEVQFADVFSRDSDRITFQAATLKFGDQTFESVAVAISETKLIVNGQEFDLETIGSIEATSTQISLPREAMGFGDVILLAAIGAFLGWQATLFTVFFSSILGSLVGLSGIAFRRMQWQTRIPYGPYLVLAAVLWVFYGQPIVQWYLHLIGR